jgi:hypothetical protein
MGGVCACGVVCTPVHMCVLLSMELRASPTTPLPSPRNRTSDAQDSGKAWTPGSGSLVLWRLQDTQLEPLGLGREDPGRAPLDMEWPVFIINFQSPRRMGWGIRAPHR